MTTSRLGKIHRLLDDVDYHLVKAFQYCVDTKSDIEGLILAFSKIKEEENPFPVSKAIVELFKGKEFIDENLIILTNMQSHWRLIKRWYTLRNFIFGLFNISRRLISLEVFTGMLIRADINVQKAKEKIEGFSSDIFESILEPIRNFQEISSEVHILLVEIEGFETTKKISWSDIPTDNKYFIDANRIKELKAIKSSEFDLTKLLRICDEINRNYTDENYLSVAMLIRALLDHVPPVLQCRNFSEVANNYAGTKSFRESMQHLDNSSRKIADAHLHVQIRSKEVLPNKTQINFANDVDVLLSEIVRLLK